MNNINDIKALTEILNRQQKELLDFCSAHHLWLVTDNGLVAASKWHGPKVDHMGTVQLFGDEAKDLILTAGGDIQDFSEECNQACVVLNGVKVMTLLNKE